MKFHCIDCGNEPIISANGANWKMKCGICGLLMIISFTARPELIDAITLDYVVTFSKTQKLD